MFWITNNETLKDEITRSELRRFVRKAQTFLCDYKRVTSDDSKIWVVGMGVVMTILFCDILCSAKNIIAYRFEQQIRNY